MKVGLIRCLQTEDMCPATTDFKVMREKKCAFQDVEGEIEIIGVSTCGGCPGKRAVTRAAEMVRRGADTIVLASCITRGNPIGFACPHAQAMKAAIVPKNQLTGLRRPETHPFNCNHVIIAYDHAASGGGDDLVPVKPDSHSEIGTIYSDSTIN